MELGVKISFGVLLCTTKDEKGLQYVFLVFTLPGEWRIPCVSQAAENNLCFKEQNFLIY